jgi:hypothetical protein
MTVEIGRGCVGCDSFECEGCLAQLFEEGSWELRVYVRC